MARKYKNWPHAVFIAVDQLGNALAGGHPEATISARVGYFSTKARSWCNYWKFLERVIDFTYEPIDGKTHCYDTWEMEAGKEFQPGSDITRAFLSIIIFAMCPFLAVMIRITVRLKPSWKYVNEQP